MKLLPVLKPNPNLHYHQCGRLRTGLLDNYGCGHVWQHRYDFELSQSIVADHKCPQCHCGPWYYELSKEELQNVTP